MAKKKYYAVKKGLTPGVYETWEECRNQVEGFSGAQYKSFAVLEEAESFAGRKFQSGLPGQMDPTEPQHLAKNSRVGSGEAHAYVDGSYNATTGEYSCGVVLYAGGKEIRLCKKGNDTELASMRNVAGEIMGAQLAMEEALKRGMRKIVIYHDYEGIAAWCRGEWKAKKDGTKAYKAFFDSVKDKIEIKFVKVRGHSGDAGNDLADALAKSVF